MRERNAMVPGLYLESIEQAGRSLVIKGNSPDESQVPPVGRSLEFSNGLFTNLSIETSRTEVANNNVPQRVNADGETPKVGIVNFTIKCGYSPALAPAPAGTNPTTASAQNPAAPNQNPQIAKN
jgi:hypothetical protein